MTSATVSPEVYRMMAAAPPGSQDAGGFRAHCDTGVPHIAGGDSWSVTGVVRMVSIKVSTDRLLWTSGGCRVDLSAQLRMSFTPFTSTYGWCG